MDQGEKLGKTLEIRRNDIRPCRNSMIWARVASSANWQIRHGFMKEELQGPERLQKAADQGLQRVLSFEESPVRCPEGDSGLIRALNSGSLHDSGRSQGVAQPEEVDRGASWWPAWPAARADGGNTRRRSWAEFTLENSGIL
jgi:hypothetical protein